MLAWLGGGESHSKFYVDFLTRIMFICRRCMLLSQAQDTPFPPRTQPSFTDSALSENFMKNPLYVVLEGGIVG